MCVSWYCYLDFVGADNNIICKGVDCLKFILGQFQVKRHSRALVYYAIPLLCTRPSHVSCETLKWPGEDAKQSA